jgi:hypothetical protein
MLCIHIPSSIYHLLLHNFSIWYDVMKQQCKKSTCSQSKEGSYVVIVCHLAYFNFRNHHNFYPSVIQFLPTEVNVLFLRMTHAVCFSEVVYCVGLYCEMYFCEYTIVKVDLSCLV